MIQGIGGGNDVADFIVLGGAGVVEGIGLNDLAIEIVVTVAGGVVEGISADSMRRCWQSCCRIGRIRIEGINEVNDRQIFMIRSRDIANFN